MRYLCIYACFLLNVSNSYSQGGVYDSLALQLLDRMSDILDDLHTVQLVMSAAKEVPDPDYGKLTQFTNYRAYYSINKFFVRSENDKDLAGYWYNGEELFYYSYKRNHYGRLEAKGHTTLEVLDSIHQKYDVDFPGLDFFYPAFTDDLIAISDRIEFFGISTIGDKECYKIATNGKDFRIELWLSRDVLTLPYHLIIADKRDNSRYEAHYDKWELNPDLPESMFNFIVPPDATRLTIVSKTN